MNEMKVAPNGRGKTILCLLRNDLRLHDNEVLFRANEAGERIVPVYCFDPRHFGTTHYFRFPRTGPHRLKYVNRISPFDTRGFIWSAWQTFVGPCARGSDLVIREGHPEVIVADLARQLGVTDVFLHREVCDEEVRVERLLEKNCGSDIPVRKFWGSTLYHIDDLPFGAIRNLPDVYTQFRKSVEDKGRIRATFAAPVKMKPSPTHTLDGKELDVGEIPAELTRQQSDVQQPPRSAFPFEGGESAALARQEDYFWERGLIKDYFNTRNGLVGPDYSTKFSPWLAFGCLSPRFINEERLRFESERGANKSTYWVFFELLWRDYFRFVGMKYGNDLFHLEGLGTTARRRYESKETTWIESEELFQAWTQGKTGVPWVDANMRELAQTGFMSNRGRQNVASFLTKELRIDWRMGAEWFESLLIDHDPTSNYGNWAYAAGVGNDPREDRKFNMLKQAKDYDGGGQYVKLWCPELQRVPNDLVHHPWTMPAETQASYECVVGRDYPSPIATDPRWQGQQQRKPVSRSTRQAVKGQQATLFDFGVSSSAPAPSRTADVKRPANGKRKQRNARVQVV